MHHANVLPGDGLANLEAEKRRRQEIAEVAAQVRKMRSESETTAIRDPETGKWIRLTPEPREEIIPCHR